MRQKVGNVTAQRYARIVAEARDVVEEQTKAQFRIGDWALEIEPMAGKGGTSAPADLLPGVGEVLRRFAEEIGVPYNTVTTYRWVCSRWPKAKRVRRVSHYVHRILASADDRFEAIHNPPENPVTGEYRWSPDTAARYVGQTPRRPETHQEKVNRVHDLARDDAVATQVVTDLLRRPDVAFKAMGDETARHHVNRAQIDRAQQVHARARAQSPSIEALEHHTAFIDLVGASSAFIAGVGRAIPRLGSSPLSVEERKVIRLHMDKVRTAASWVDDNLDNPQSLEEGLAQILGSDTP